MNALLKTLLRHFLCWQALALACACHGQTPLPPPRVVAEPLPAQASAPPREGLSASRDPAEMMPGDFLDVVSQNTKARWRMLYRDASTSAPPAERLKVAFTLGGLLADSYLALQAGHAQQFKNINQDVLKYCGSLGLMDKVSPMLMSGSKMAEGEDWGPLRSKVNDTQKLVQELLREQRDEDLAVLVHVGLWLRLYDITSTIVQSDTQMANKTLCIGSLPHLSDLVVQFNTLTSASRQDPAIALVGKTLHLLEKHWIAAEGRPTQELVDMTQEKVRFLMNKLTIK